MTVMLHNMVLWHPLHTWKELLLLVGILWMRRRLCLSHVRSTVVFFSPDSCLYIAVLHFGSGEPGWEDMFPRLLKGYYLYMNL